MLESKGRTSDRVRVQFHKVVRHTSGRGRDVILNLESLTPTGLTIEMAFSELLEEFGEENLWQPHQWRGSMPARRSRGSQRAIMPLLWRH